MEDVSKTVKSYFVLLEKLCLLWETNRKRVSKSLNAIENYADQLQAVSSIDSEVSLNTQFPELKGQITFMTLMCLERELLTVIHTAKEIGLTTEKLNDFTMQLYQQIESLDSSSNSVSTHTLLEAVSDSRQYNQARSSGLQISLKCLDYWNWQTIKELRKSFSEEKSQRLHLERCMLLIKCFISEADPNIIQP